MSSAPRPVRLPANYVARFYRGGTRLGAFRGTPAGEFDGEDWIGSTTPARGGSGGLGLSRAEDGTTVADLLAGDPVGHLGAAHFAAYGTGTELLVKLLDPGERLAVHCHPTDGFARDHLSLVHGKTEAWLVLDAPEDAAVHLGFTRDVDPGQLRAWVAGQDVPAMLGALNRIPVRAGDAVLVPAGVPHAIGAGVFLAELQQPADLSLMLERPEGTGDDWHLGLGADLALAAVDRSAWTGDRLGALRLAAPVPDRTGVARLLPPLADPFFRAESVEGGASLEPAMAVFVGAAATLRLSTALAGDVELGEGEALLMPHGAGGCSVTGPGRAIRCLPPLPPAVHEPARPEA
jgi:mannose-6-phosphate isomerase